MFKKLGWLVSGLAAVDYCIKLLFTRKQRKLLADLHDTHLVTIQNGLFRLAKKFKRKVISCLGFRKRSYDLQVMSV